MSHLASPSGRGNFLVRFPQAKNRRPGRNDGLSRPGLRLSCRRSTNPATANARLSLPRRFDLAFFRANGAARALKGAPFGSQGRCLHQHGRHILNALPGSSTRPRGGIANQRTTCPASCPDGAFSFLGGAVQARAESVISWLRKEPSRNNVSSRLGSARSNPTGDNHRYQERDA